MDEHRLLETLPEVIRVTALPGTPLAALDAVADDLHAPVSAVLDHLDDVPDPFRTPSRFVAFLAGWVDLAWLTTEVADGATSAPVVPPDRLRDLVAASADLSARRGTPGGLARFLHLATGVDGFAVQEVPGTFHVRVVVPPAAVDRLPLVERLVRMLKPAHVTGEVVPGPAEGTGSGHPAAEAGTGGRTDTTGGAASVPGEGT